MENYEKLILQENFLSNEDCNELIKIHDELWSQKRVLHNDTEVLNVMHMLNYDNKKCNFIKHIHAKISLHIKNIDKNAFINFFEVVKWNEGLGMEEHYDFTFHKWTSVIYLNDDYSGGNTFIEHKEIIPLKGKIVTFQGANLLHGVTPILNGVRYTSPVWYRSL